MCSCGADPAFSWSEKCRNQRSQGGFARFFNFFHLPIYLSSMKNIFLIHILVHFFKFVEQTTCKDEK